MLGVNRGKMWGDKYWRKQPEDGKDGTTDRDPTGMMKIRRRWGKGVRGGGGRGGCELWGTRYGALCNPQNVKKKGEL